MKKLIALALAVIMAVPYGFSMTATAASGEVYQKIDQADVHEAPGYLYARALANAQRLETGTYANVDWVFNNDHGNWAGDMQGRLILGAVRQAAILHDRQSTWLSTLMNKMMEYRVDGAYMNYAYTPGHPIEQYFSGHSWFLRAMCEVYKYNKDPRALETLLNLVDGMLIGGREDIAAYPTRQLTDSSSDTGDGRWSLSGGDTACFFMMVDGATDAYHVLKGIDGQEARAAQLKEVIDIYVNKYQLAEPVAKRFQTHATLTAVRGLIRYYGDTGEQLALELAIKRMNEYRKFAMTEDYQNYNWWQRPQWTEGCAVIDSYEASIDLFRVTGDVEWLEYSQWILYTGLGFNQFPNGGFGTDNCLGTGGQTTLSRGGEAPQCCVMRGGEGMADAILYQYLIDPSGALLALQYTNSTYTYRSPTGDVTIKQESNYPDESTVKFTITDPGSSTGVRLKLFVPSFVTAFSLSVDGVPVQNPATDGSFLTVDLNPQTDTTVDFSFNQPITFRSTRESAGHVAGLVYARGFAELGWFNTAGEADLPFAQRTLEPLYKAFTNGKNSAQVIASRLNAAVGLPAAATSGDASPVTDGSKASGWTSERQTSKTAEQSVTVDFGVPTPIDVVTVYPLGSGAKAPRTYAVEMSADGDVWKTINAITEADVNSYANPFETDVKPQQTARYVRVRATELAPDGAEGYVAEIGEIEIYSASAKTLRIQSDNLTHDRVSVNGSAPRKLPFVVSAIAGTAMDIALIPADDPAPENVFVGWSGAASGIDRRLGITLEDDATLTAHYGPSSFENLALGRSVTSNSLGADNANWALKNLTDGYIIHPNAANSVGYTSTGTASPDVSVSPVTIQVDLGENKDFNIVKLFPRDDGYYAVDGDYANFPKDFTISVKAEGENDFTVIKTVTGAAPPTFGVAVYDVGPQTARYILLTVTRKGDYAAADPQYRVQLAELTVYDTGEMKARDRLTITGDKGLKAVVNGRTLVLPSTTTFPAGTIVAVSTSEPDFWGWSGFVSSSHREIRFIIEKDVTLDLNLRRTSEISLVPHADMTAAATSQMADDGSADARAGNGPASWAIDGNLNTWWNVKYTAPAADPQLPQSITLTFNGAARNVCRLEYRNRAGSGTIYGNITQYVLEGRLPDGEWRQLDAGTWDGASDLLNAAAFDPVAVTAVRLTALACTGSTGRYYVAAREINVYEMTYTDDLVSHDEMTATATSEMDTMAYTADAAAGNGGASWAIDGRLNTWWHIDYKNPPNPLLPQSITLAFDRTINADKLVYFRRSGGGDQLNGNITQYKLEGLTPAGDWLTLAAGQWADTSGGSNAVIFSATRVDALRLTAERGHGGWACAAEIDVYERRELTPITPEPFQSFQTVTELGDNTIKISSAAVNNRDSAQPMYGIFALYDENGRLLGIEKQETVLQPGQERTLPYHFDSLLPDVRYTAKLFYFGPDPAYTPLAENCQFLL
ncbi:MAG: discoidin domain-containing protein [Oscillospiraceae bacterium]|nr:discoidin domain-containing protein [Oscillospiraceae bacterium]